MADDAADFAELQRLLDMISDQPGAILYRADDRWRALVPDRPGLVLTLNERRMPAWLPDGWTPP